MGIESGIVARLKAVSAVTALVGTRIYADTLPDKTTKPAIIYQLISDVPISALNDDTGKSRARIQFTLLSDTKSGNISLTAAMRTALQRFSGAISDIVIHDSMLENVFDTSYDLKTGITARIMDFMVLYE